MRITQAKLKDFKKMAIERRKLMRDEFQESHRVFNNQHSLELKTISEYNFWGGYEYAMLKVEQYMRLKPKDENNEPIQRRI